MKLYTSFTTHTYYFVSDLLLWYIQAKYEIRVSSGDQGSSGTK